MQLSIHKGAVAPYSLTVVLTSSDPGFDLSTATAASFKVLRPNVIEGSEETWAAAISNASRAGNDSEVQLTHEYAAEDTAKSGVLQLCAMVTTPDGTIVSDPFKLLINSKFAR